MPKKDELDELNDKDFKKFFASFVYAYITVKFIHELIEEEKQEQHNASN